MRATRKMSVAPTVAPITAADAPTASPNRNPPVDREKYRARQRQGDGGDIERDIGEHGQDPVLADEGVDGHAVPDQRRERDPATARR